MHVSTVSTVFSLRIPGTPDIFKTFCELFVSFCFGTSYSRGAQIPGVKSHGPPNFVRGRLIYVELTLCHNSGAWNLKDVVTFLKKKIREPLSHSLVAA
jgi:hypothetical protein